MSQPAPLIFTGPTRPTGVGWLGRLTSFGVSAGCLAVLLVAAHLRPDPSGHSTHTQLGMPACQFLARTNVPCPSCGMTSSFAWFVRGNLLASVYVQPMGALLAGLTAAAFWIGLYIGLTGNPAIRLLATIPPSYYVVPLMAFGLIAWGWKIYIHLQGIDGW